MVPAYTLTFPGSPARTYRAAVVLAQRATRYREERPGQSQRLHIAEFDESPDALARCAELWVLCRTWKTARLMPRGGPAVAGGRRWRPLEVMQCEARAAKFRPPQRYCCSGEPGPGSGLPPALPVFPCRWYLRRGGPALARVDWEDPHHRMAQLRANLLEAGALACPFLDLRPFEAALARWTPGAPPRDRGRRGCR